MKSEKVIIHGWINLDKPVGISSAKAVAIIRKHLNCHKIGHGGTLDPLAGGVLPIALGEATKTVSYVMNSEKTYEFTLKWGYETSTDDLEGEPTRTSDKKPTKNEIEECIPEFVGRIQQTPPIYSAVKVSGKRAYSIARSSETNGGDTSLILEPREVEIHHLALKSITDDDATFTVFCGKGTYIRALGRDLGRRLGAAGHISNLKRLSVGKFSTNDAISLDFLTSLRDSADAYKYVIPLTAALDDIPALSITPEEAGRIRMGQRVPYFGNKTFENQTCVAICDGSPIALITLDLGIIHPVRVFNL
ncbi:tRNA pseudouridine(55) synthase TruB [Alphaproteobacteria bacterium]|jgi:tRNA pseudouridine55 synthase|nr:tRNA pseudouridine(55) synthase TruB [Alphaproteobacteria bacterium]